MTRRINHLSNRGMAPSALSRLGSSTSETKQNRFPNRRTEKNSTLNKLAMGPDFGAGRGKGGGVSFGHQSIEDVLLDYFWIFCS